MIILVMRTDKPEAEIGLFNGHQQLAYETWFAHRELAETVHHKLEALLGSMQKSFKDIQGVVVYHGPGSFTGLRIGISVANALGEGLAVPVVGSGQENWAASGIDRLLAGESDGTVLPEYGAPVHITHQKK